jgi:hypothetical protein
VASLPVFLWDRGTPRTVGLVKVSPTVSFRPWPPCFQSLTSLQKPSFVPFRSKTWRVELRSWNETAAEDLRRAILVRPGFFVFASLALRAGLAGDGRHGDGNNPDPGTQCARLRYIEAMPAHRSNEENTAMTPWCSSSCRNIWAPPRGGRAQELVGEMASFRYGASKRACTTPPFGPAGMRRGELQDQEYRPPPSRGCD